LPRPYVAKRVLRAFPFDVTRLVRTAGEELGESITQRQQLIREKELDPSVLPARGDLAKQFLAGPRRFKYLIEQRDTVRIVDRTTVVGVDQAEIPEFVALIGVGNSGSGELDHRLAQRIERSESRDPRLKFAEVSEKVSRFVACEERVDETE
jgi:hypothetical protein